VHTVGVDLTPGYREFPPPAALRGLLSCVWVRVATASENRVVPDACSDLVWRQGSGVFVAGPDTGPMHFEYAPGDVFAGVRFAPGAGDVGIGVPLHELRDRRVALADLDPRAVVAPADAYPAEAVRSMLRLVAGRALDGSTDPLMRVAVRMLAAPDSRVETLAARLEISERQLRRRFAASVGYGPKTLHRVLRFQRAQAMLAVPGAGLAEIAAATGYADQAHLSRECLALGGRLPTAIRAMSA
jgi:AraC-like DNA-binding protein